VTEVKTEGSSWNLAAALERLYRGSLWIYPAVFRRAFGREMTEAFRDSCLYVRRRGRVRLLLHGLHALGELFVHGALERSLLLRRAAGKRRSAGHASAGSRRPGRRGARSALESALRDVLFGLRLLRRRPLYTSVAVLTLGLGIGAATAMFSVVDGVLLKPLPFDDPGRLVAIWQTVPELRGTPGDDGARWDRYRLTYPQYRELLEQSTVYEGLAGYRAGTPDVANLTGIGDPVELRAGAATASLLPVLGVRPALGRWFQPEEEASIAGDDGAAVAVISHELWQGRFGGSPEVLGKVVTIDDRSFTIVGILPAGFRIQWLSAAVAGEGDPGERDIWFPIGAPGWSGSQHGYSWETIGRLASGGSVDRARAETHLIMSAHPHTFGEARVLPRSAEERRGLTPPLVLLFAATAFLLLIACGNIATLSLGEMSSRQHEIATRSALGAGAGRIVRLFLTESFVLAALGSAVGAALAFGGTRVLVSLAPPIPRLYEVGVDLRVLGFAVLLGTCAAFLFGTVPSIVAARGAVGPPQPRSAGTSPGRRRFANIVLATEIALTAMLLVAGGLLARSLSRLLAVDPGFEARGLATVEVKLPRTRYPTRESQAAFFRAALDRLEAVPGIGSVSAVSRLPFPGYTSGWSIRIERRDEQYAPLGYQVAPGYLRTLGVPLLAGRPLAETDGPEAPLAVVINETMARRYWPDESPIGARFSWGGSAGPVTVVGIAGDMKRQVLQANTEPAFFIPFVQHPDETICFVARTRLSPRDVIPLMHEAVRTVDGDLVVKNATTVAALVAQSTENERYRALLMGVFGILAALLAAVGVFGVAARSVALRTREMGIRMALGARAAGLIGTTMRGILVIGLAGTAVGLVGALWTSNLLARFLFEVEPSDPTTYGLVAASIVLVCSLASYVPARRITRVNPVDVLRAD
jgi:putative ABC transport system permease protein